MLGKVKVLSSKFVATAREPREVIPSGSTSDGNFRVDRIVVAPIDVKLEGVSNVSETILDSQKASSIVVTLFGITTRISPVA